MITNKTPLGVIVMLGADGEELPAGETLAMMQAICNDPAVVVEYGWEPGDKRDLRLVRVKATGEIRAAVKCGGCGQCSRGNHADEIVDGETVNLSDGPGSTCGHLAIAAATPGVIPIQVNKGELSILFVGNDKEVNYAQSPTGLHPFHSV